MKVYNKYIISIWEKSFFTNLLSCMYQLPFIIIISLSIFQLIVPIYNNYNFIKRSNHNYIYTINQGNINNSNQDAKVLLYQREISSYYKPELSIDDDFRLYSHSIATNLYICQEDYPIEKTYFTEKNYLKNINSTSPYIWLTYDNAKKLHVNIGDKVEIRFVEKVKDKAKLLNHYFEFTVTGILKPGDSNGLALLVVNNDLFNQIKKINVENGISSVFFTDTPLGNEFKDNFITKSGQLDAMYKQITSTAFLTKAIITLSVSCFALFVINGFEINFLLKRNKNNMMILNMLGVPINQIRKLFVKMLSINYFISLIAALLIVKLFFLDIVQNLYIEPLPIIITSLAFLLVGEITIILHAFKLKSI